MRGGPGYCSRFGLLLLVEHSLEYVNSDLEHCVCFSIEMADSQPDCGSVGAFRLFKKRRVRFNPEHNQNRGEAEAGKGPGGCICKQEIGETSEHFSKSLETLSCKSQFLQCGWFMGGFPLQGVR